MRLSLLPLEKDDVIRLQCEGQISLRNTAAGSRDPLEVLLGPRCFSHKVLLNLERAEGIDTSGLSWLMRAHERFREAKGMLVLYQVPPGVTMMLDYLKLSPLLAIAPGEAAARAIAGNGEGPGLNPYRQAGTKDGDREARLLG